jgi:tetratricopeptide (TPR) repeat protein
MADFAAESAPYASRNPRIEALQGFADWDRGSMLARAGEKVEALQEFHEAIRFGDFWRFRFERGQFYTNLERYAEALEDFTSALVQRPQHADILFERALVEYNIGRKASGAAKATSFSQGFRDIELAAALDPTDERYQQVLAFYRDSLPEFAPSARP